MKNDLQKLYTKLINSALKGNKTNTEIEQEFYTEYSKILGIDYTKLNEIQKKKIKIEIDSYDKKISKKIETNLDKSNIQDISIDKTFDNSFLQKEIDNFKNHGKEVIKNTYETENDITLNELIKSSLSLSSKRKDIDMSKFIKLNTISHNDSTGKLLYDLDVKSTSKNDTYKVYLEFYGVLDTKSKNQNIKLENDVVLDKPLKNTTSVKVSCTCPDYLYTFSNANYQKKCHYGVLPSSFKQESKERNVKHLIGICRHLVSAINYLDNKNLLN